MRRGWLQFEFFLAGQTNHWSLNRLPWQITMHSCPPTVEIKLCPVSASFVFSSPCLCPSPLPSARILLFLKLLRPHKGAQPGEALGGVCNHARKIKISQLTMQPAFLHEETHFLLQMDAFAYASHIREHKTQTRAHNYRGVPSSLSECLLDCVLLHLWPLPRVLFICGWSCFCCGQSEKQTLQLFHWCVNMLGISTPSPQDSWTSELWQAGGGWSASAAMQKQTQIMGCYWVIYSTKRKSIRTGILLTFVS